MGSARQTEQLMRKCAKFERQSEMMQGLGLWASLPCGQWVQSVLLFREVTDLGHRRRMNWRRGS